MYDTDLPKRGKFFELLSRIYSHVTSSFSYGTLYCHKAHPMQFSGYDKKMNNALPVQAAVDEFHRHTKQLEAF
jgi:hypothetical protein